MGDIIGQAGSMAGSGMSLAGGIAGDLLSQGDRDKAQALQDQALQQLQDLATPELKDAAFKQYVSAGILSPSMEQTVTQKDSSLGGYQTDPRIAQAQMGALQNLQTYGNGGLRPEDLAAMAQERNQINQQSNGKDQSILQDMQQRGQGGSGAELAARLSNSQNAANQLNNSSNSNIQSASARALQALSQQGSLAGQMSQQNFGQAAQKASAQDAINRFNSQNSQAVNNANTQAANYAQQYNLGNNQSISNQNTGLANQAQMYNNQIAQENYNNAFGKQNAVYNAQQGRANQYTNSANQTANMWSQIGQGAGQMTGAALANKGGGSGGGDDEGGEDDGGAGDAMGAMAMFSDENLKEGIKDGSPEIHKMLDKLSPHEYNYKDPSVPMTGEGQHFSPMAQEFEKTKAGKSMVKDTPKGKVVDYGKSFGVMMAALADQHHRLKKLEGKGK